MEHLLYSPETVLEGRQQGGDALWAMTFNKVMCAKQNTWEIPDRKGGRIWEELGFTLCSVGTD